MRREDASAVLLAREYVQLSREVKRKKERMKELLTQLGQRVVQGITLPELGVRLVQQSGKYRSYSTRGFHDALGLEALLACATIDPVKVDAHLKSMPPTARIQAEVQLGELLEVTLKPRHVIENLTAKTVASAV